MPSLFRFLFTIAVLVGLAYGAMYALVLYVEPKQREMTVRVPSGDINPVRAPRAPEPEVDEATEEEAAPAE